VIGRTSLPRQLSDLNHFTLAAAAAAVQQFVKWMQRPIPIAYTRLSGTVPVSSNMNKNKHLLLTLEMQVFKKFTYGKNFTKHFTENFDENFVSFYTYRVVQKNCTKFNAPSFCNRLQ